MKMKFFYLFSVIFFMAAIMISPLYGANGEDLTFYISFENSDFSSDYSKGDGKAKIGGRVTVKPGRNGGHAALFANRGDTLTFAVPGNINLPQGAISLWVKELDTNENQLIWNPYFQIFGKDKVFNIGRLWQPQNVAGGLWQGGQKITMATGSVAKKGQWHNYIFTWRKNEIRMYFDGNLTETISDGSFILNDSDGTFTLGRPKKPTLYADGWHTGTHMHNDAPKRAREMKIGVEPYGEFLLDDVAIFNRYLIGEEAKEIFNKPMSEVIKSGLKAGSPSISIEANSGKQRIRINADFGKRLPAGAKVMAEILDSNGKSTGSTIEIQQAPGGLEFGYINTDTLQPGEYQVKVWAQLKDTILATIPVGKFKLAGKEPWIDNTYGAEDVVLPGFEPLKADENMAAIWGREYKFDGQLMPKQITNQGSKMLARPISWYVKTSKGLQRLVTTKSKLVSSSPTRAVYETQGKLGGLKVKGRVTVEYDGFMKYELEFIPGSKPVAVDKLYMEIPFTPECATMLYHPTRRSGTWDDGWQKEFQLIYTNIITIGTPDLCLQWLTESDQYYYPRGSKKVFESVNEKGAHVFRNNVIEATKNIASPFKLVFALQAGPVKARPKNWRSWTMSSQMADLDRKKYDDIHYRYDWWARAPGELIPRKGFPKKRDDNLFKNQIQVTSIHFAGYRDYDEKDREKRTPEWQRYESQWIRLPKLYEPQGCPGWANTYVDTNSRSWSQWYIYNAYKLFSLTGMRGLYFDDWRHGPSMNEAAGSGYVDEEGIRRPIQPIFSQREIHRRIYAIVKKFRPDDGIIIIHTASQVMLPIIGFSDVIYDGEIMIWTDLIPPAGDYFKTYRNDLFQSLFQCKQFGPVPAFHDMTMQYARNFKDKVGSELLFVPNQRKLWAILLTHDIQMHAGFVSGAERIVNLWMDSFGITDPAIKFHPYWEPKPATDIIGGYWPEGNVDNNSKYWASAYSKPGKALVVVVRDCPTNICGTTTVKVKLDRKKLGLPDGPLRCTNLESLGRSPLGQIDGDVLSVDIAPISVSMDCTFAGVIIEPVKDNAKNK